MSGNMKDFGVIFVLIFSFICYVDAIPEQGLTKYRLNYTEEKACAYDEVIVRRTMYTGSYFRVQAACAKEQLLTIKVVVVELLCENVFADEEDCKIPEKVKPETVAENVNFITSYDVTLKCDKNKRMILIPQNSTEDKSKTANKTEANIAVPPNATYVAKKDGIYLMVLAMRDSGPVDIVVESRSDYGYLSAADWAQLPFFRVMFVVYFFFTIIWLVLCCCHRKDLLRIQYWIGGVIFIGLIEKAVFLGEYETLNKTGQSVYGAIIFGELVSSAKKMLSRMLIIVVSVGFGIVRPRLGATLHKVLAVGFVYFIASAVEGCVRASKERVENDRMRLFADLVLAVVDAGICWWIFSSILQTMRVLRLRRNVVKLGLYRHFMNTLIFAILASVGFMVWSFVEHRWPKCPKDWKELWVDEAFWHLLFAIILLVIMILWRPSANNQRYAYSPLTDAADEAEEPMMNEAFDGMKMRGQKSQENSSRTPDAQMEDDLKWIDENIPASVADRAIPSLLDSEEEIVNTNFEMSKMQ